MTEKRNIHALIEKEAPSLNNLLDPEDVKEFKAMTAELRDTWTKKQVFRTETEMRMSVLQDMKYPTKAAKYWQCVREQNVFLENLMTLSFDCRRKEAKIKWLEKKLKTGGTIPPGASTTATEEFTGETETVTARTLTTS